MSTTESQLTMFEGYRCDAAELAITGCIPMAGLESLTIDTEVAFAIEVGERRYPVTGRVSRRQWTRKLDKDSGEVYVVPRTTISITPDPVSTRP
jgi:hypothetical protein